MCTVITKFYNINYNYIRTILMENSIIMDIYISIVYNMKHKHKFHVKSNKGSKLLVNLLCIIVWCTNIVT